MYYGNLPADHNSHLNKFNYRLVTLHETIYASIHISNFLDITLYFKLIKFTFHTFPLLFYTYILFVSRCKSVSLSE